MQHLPHEAICPYLGTQEDPETSFSFPSAQNFCWGYAPPRRVRHDYQSTNCLTAEYSRCPVLFVQAVPPSPTEAPTQPSPEVPSSPTAPDTDFPTSPQRFQDLPLTPCSPTPERRTLSPIPYSPTPERRTLSPIPSIFRHLAALEIPLLALLAFLLTLALLALLALKY